MSDMESNTPEGEDEAASAEAASPEPEPEPLSPLEEVTQERDRLKDQLLRTAADFDNFRKRTRKDLEQADRRGREEVLRELLPVFDNLERAVEASEGATDIVPIREGVQMVLKLFEDARQRVGLERVESIGQRFDPSLHDAFQQTETDDHPPGTILAEYQAGYRLGERLIRPAMVVVARKKPEPQGD